MPHGKSEQRQGSNDRMLRRGPNFNACDLNGLWVEDVEKESDAKHSNKGDDARQVSESKDDEEGAEGEEVVVEVLLTVCLHAPLPVRERGQIELVDVEEVAPRARGLQHELGAVLDGQLGARVDGLEVQVELRQRDGGGGGGDGALDSVLRAHGAVCNCFVRGSHFWGWMERLGRE